jgi:hypothetical protein
MAIEQMQQHRQFVAALDNMDASVFFTIPSLLILYSLQNNNYANT